MKWSWKIARIAGIDVYIHSTFFLLLTWIGFSFWLTERSISAVMNGLVFILLLFLFVLMHEFGHALVARKYGILTRDITLLPIGGVARLERMPTDPKQELWVALAGPMVNLGLAVILFGWLLITNTLNPFQPFTLTSGSLVFRLATVNLSLLLFNLIPAFPMDGGRVLRAFLATKMEYTRATQTAATIGQGIALIFGLIGLFSNPFLVFIALFVWIGASQEASMVQVRNIIGGVPVRRAMLTQFRALHPTQRLQDAIEATLNGYQQDFPILDNDRLVGILTRPKLMQALSQDGNMINIASVMDQDFQSAEANEMLEMVSERLQTCGCRTLPVIDNGVLVGMITMENIGEFMMIETALKRSK
jgi:Zn-dependent protease